MIMMAIWQESTLSNDNDNFSDVGQFKIKLLYFNQVDAKGEEDMKINIFIIIKITIIIMIIMTT